LYIYTRIPFAIILIVVQKLFILLATTVQMLEAFGDLQLHEPGVGLKNSPSAGFGLFELLLGAI
jgi:hypothetical protein